MPRPPKVMPISDDLAQQMYAEYQAGCSLRGLAAAYGLRNERIRAAFVSRGWPRRSAYFSPPVEQKLLARRHIAPNGCWEWTGYRTARGYASFLRKGRGSSVLVHRAAYEVWVGPIPEGMLVCHRCDNPPCFNPEHLFLGTAKDNTADMIAKGRGPKGCIPGAKA